MKLKVELGYLDTSYIYSKCYYVGTKELSNNYHENFMLHAKLYSSIDCCRCKCRVISFAWLDYVCVYEIENKNNEAWKSNKGGFASCFLL